jgi:hypothetical protein
MPYQDGSPADSHELNRQLADTIGASVEALLGLGGTEADNMRIDAALEAARRGNAAGGPPAGGGSTQEQPAGGGPPAAAGGAPATTAQSQASVVPQEGEIDWESVKAANGLYLGKYKTKAEAVRGVAHTVAMAKVAFTRSEEIERRNADLAREVQELRARPAVAQIAAPQAPVQPAPSRGQEDAPSPVLATVLAKIQDGETLNAEDLLNVVKADRESYLGEARKAAREEFDARKAEAEALSERWGKVEAHMAEKFPDSVNFTDELALYVKTHPMIAAGVNALIAQDRHEEAMEEAWGMYARDHKIAPAFVPAPATKENVEREIQLDAADQVRREAVDAARRDAGIIGAAGARGVHENANTGASQGEYDEAVALMNAGDGRKWRALVFGDALNHPIFGN